MERNVTGLRPFSSTKSAPDSSVLVNVPATSSVVSADADQDARLSLSLSQRPLIDRFKSYSFRGPAVKEELYRRIYSFQQPGTTSFRTDNLLIDQPHTGVMRGGVLPGPATERPAGSIGYRC